MNQINTKNTANQKDGIILLAKKAGLTSFSSLNSVKKALNTKKVGHTGTLDSFAQGLLIVCTGRFTKLAGKITEFNKTYQAVIKFGEETDTYEYTGKITNKANLPNKSDFENAVKKFIGEIMQKPPIFSAVHINGERSSNLARKGKTAEIPARKITVFNSKILDTICNEKNQVEYALMEFCVSKGTYIRSLAFDIGRECNSAALLAGLYRTKVGNFSVENAAGFEQVKNFTIQTAINEMNIQKRILKENEQQKCTGKSQLKFAITKDEIKLQQEIKEKMQDFTPQFSVQCGFTNVFLANEKSYENFKNGKPPNESFFDKSVNLKKIAANTEIAVFTSEPKLKFAGLIEKKSDNHFQYKFVIGN